MTHFYRLSGGGNDFLALVEPPDPLSPERIEAWCRRGVSVGADGLFLLERSPSGATMTHYNCDGTAADLCLNGTRCAVQLACHLGWTQSEIDILTDAGTVRGQQADQSRVALTLPTPARPRQRELAVDSEAVSVWSVLVGVPHVVVLWNESLLRAPVADLGAKLRSHPELGTEGANVDFVRYIAQDRLEMRTFERGVEAETLACGTGVLAAVAVGLELERSSLPVDALTLGGFELSVDQAPGADPAYWVLTGDARIIAEGHILDGALDLPAQVLWSD
jgi:diaminopimelate epimerase